MGRRKARAWEGNRRKQAGMDEMSTCVGREWRRSQGQGTKTRAEVPSKGWIYKKRDWLRDRDSLACVLFRGMNSSPLAERNRPRLGRLGIAGQLVIQSIDHLLGLISIKGHCDKHMYSLYVDQTHIGSKQVGIRTSEIANHALADPLSHYVSGHWNAK